MSNSSDENSSADPESAEGSPLGISDDQLPEDLVPSEDNPLAQGLDDGETVEGLMEGSSAEQSEQSEGDASNSDGSEDA